MDVPYKLYKGDCREFLPKLEYSVIISDVPYPDYNAEHGKDWEYVPLETLPFLPVRQFIFFPADKVFPLDYTARHVWHKKNSQSAYHYEFIYERNGGLSCYVFSARVVTSWLTAQFAQDVLYNHPTQKPIKLMSEIILKFTKPDDVILDPFMGSGTTIEAAIKAGRHSIGIEKNDEYYSIAEKRISQAAQQPALFHATQQSVQRTGGESGQQSLFSAGEVLPAKVTRQTTRR